MIWESRIGMRSELEVMKTKLADMVSGAKVKVEAVE